MRTTLTLEKDVAAMVARLRKARGHTLEGLVNDALGEGLNRLATRSPAGGRFETRAVDLGKCFVHDVDDTAVTIAGAESESIR